MARASANIGSASRARLSDSRTRGSRGSTSQSGWRAGSARSLPALRRSQRRAGAADAGGPDVDATRSGSPCVPTAPPRSAGPGDGGTRCMNTPGHARSRRGPGTGPVSVPTRRPALRQRRPRRRIVAPVFLEAACNRLFATRAASARQRWNRQSESQTRPRSRSSRQGLTPAPSRQQHAQRP